MTIETKYLFQRRLDRRANKINEMKKLIIHKRELTKDVTAYFFTKSKNSCLCVEYDKTKDYGEKSSSGAEMEIIIHYQNSWVKDKLTEIKMEDVPSVIIDVLRYLV